MDSINRNDKLKAEIILESGERITTVGELLDLANRKGTLFVDFTTTTHEEWRKDEEEARLKEEAEEWHYEQYYEMGKESAREELAKDTS